MKSLLYQGASKEYLGLNASKLRLFAGAFGGISEQVYAGLQTVPGISVLFFRGATNSLAIRASTENAPGPKMKTIKETSRKRNAASETNASGSLKMFSKTSRLAV
ncbi:MAG TPA: hypothetical protein VIS71_02865, partial [Terrimicrobium sp.]